MESNNETSSGISRIYSPDPNSIDPYTIAACRIKEWQESGTDEVESPSRKYRVDRLFQRLTDEAVSRDERPHLLQRIKRFLESSVFSWVLDSVSDPLGTPFTVCAIAVWVQAYSDRTRRDRLPESSYVEVMEVLLGDKPYINDEDQGYRYLCRALASILLPGGDRGPARSPSDRPDLASELDHSCSSDGDSVHSQSQTEE